MSYPFNIQEGLIRVEVAITGPQAQGFAVLALDTGATTTTISAAILLGLGYDPALTTEHVQVTMGSSVLFVPIFPLMSITALGQFRQNFPVLCHTLPPSAGVDGVLGLDFFRGHALTLDFANGRISLT